MFVVQQTMCDDIEGRLLVGVGPAGNTPLLGCPSWAAWRILSFLEQPEETYMVGVICRPLESSMLDFVVRRWTTMYIDRHWWTLIEVDGHRDMSHDNGD